MSSADDVVTRFCAAWSKNDLDALMAFFTDDAVYENVPVDPPFSWDWKRHVAQKYLRRLRTSELARTMLRTERPARSNVTRLTCCLFCQTARSVPLRALLSTTSGDGPIPSPARSTPLWA